MTSKSKYGPKDYTRKPVTVQVMQMPFGYPEGTDPSSDNYSRNLQASEVYSWVEKNTEGTFEFLSVLEEGKPAPASGVSIDPSDGRMVISTRDGLYWVDLGDYIIREVDGGFYPCNPSTFAASYDLADEGAEYSE